MRTRGRDRGRETEAEKQKKNSHYVVCDNYVTMSDGTGIVHIAPAFGEDDSRLGRKYDLPYLQFVDGAGNMTEETEFAGVFIKKADPLIHNSKGILIKCVLRSVKLVNICI